MFVSGLLAPWYENMTLSTKPEVHNVSQRHHRMSEPQPQSTCTENLVKFSRVVFELCERTLRQTDILITILWTPKYKQN